MSFDTFCDCATIRRFASQQQIFHEGGEADHFYLIITGNVALETFVPGRGMVTNQTLGAGDALGWSWLFPPHKWHFTASTREPTEVISLNAVALRGVAEEDREFHDELVTRVARTLHQRLLGTREQLVDLYGMRP
jgi:CRP-like cAMP-binding protein